MGDNVIGTVRGRNGREFEVKWNDWGNVYVREIGVLGFTTWDGPSQKATSAGEAMRIAEAFVYNK